MNEMQKKIKVPIDKEAVKKWLKEQLTHPSDGIERKQEIDRVVEESARCADFIEFVADLCDIDLEKFILKMFGLK